MIRSRTLPLAAAVAAALAVAACNKEQAAAPAAAPAVKAPAAAAGEDPSTPVVRYGGKTLTLKDVDEKVGPQLKQLEKQKLDLRRQTAEQLVVQDLVKQEAAKAGLTEEAYFKANVDDKVPPPTEDQIKKVFEDNKSQMPPGSTVQSMREQIIRFLTDDQRRRVAQEIFTSLKQQAGYQVLLEEPRVVVEAKGPSKGAADAKVTIVEFSDFECPFCSRAEESVNQVMAKYQGKVRIVYRHFPLSFHPHAQKAAEAAACADAQGKFWEMHKQLFANQRKLAPEDLKAHAAAVGLDAAKFATCLDGAATKALVEADTKAGAEAGVNGTPAFFINGKVISGAQPFEEFQKIIDAELAKGS